MAQIFGKLNDVEAWGGEGGMLPPGEYHFMIENAAQGQSKGGKPQLELDLVVIGEGELKGRKCKQWYTLNFEKDAPRKRLKALIVATGVPLAGDGSFDDTQLKGTTFVADLVAGSYEVVDPVTGQKVAKENTRVQNERGAHAGAGAAARPAAAPSGFTANAPAAAAYPAPARGNPLTPVNQ